MISIVKQVNDNLAVLRYVLYNQKYERLCTRSKTRKSATCLGCKREISKGSYAWRPQTNGADRMVRICESCILY